MTNPTADSSANQTLIDHIIWQASPSQVLNFPKYLLLFGIGVLSSYFAFYWTWLIVGILAGWLYLSLSTTGYILYPDRLVVKSGILNLDNEQTELFRILDLHWSQPLYLRLFGLGNLSVYTSSDITNEMNMGEAGRTAKHGHACVLLRAIDKNMKIEALQLETAEAWRHICKRAQIQRRFAAIEALN